MSDNRREGVRHASRVAWRAIGFAGELLITLGVLIVLFVTYQLWWTNVVAERESSHVATELREEWQAPQPPEPTEPPADEKDFSEAFAFIYVPRLKDKVWGLPVLNSVETSALAHGIGHYPDTQKPGEKGNFAVAGHRATNGEPLRDIDKVKAGDEVIVETRDDWYVYRLEKTKIVQPHEVWVIDPVPGHPDEKPSKRLVTLTTCHPRWGSTQRWIWWGEQVERLDKASGDVPEEIEKA